MFEDGLDPNGVRYDVAVVYSTAHAKMLFDVVDYDHQVAFSTGGIPELDASFGALATFSMTATYVPDCHGAMTGLGCDDRLRLVIGSLWWPAVQDVFLDMIEQTPALQRFDAGQESGKPRHLKNVRTFVVDAGIALVGDLCNPDAADCD